jgi:hypothetical protein
MDGRLGWWLSFLPLTLKTMGKGRKSKTVLPSCECHLVYKGYIVLIMVVVIELSDDGKKIHCSICDMPGNTGWILKESLAYHLKSDVHARALSAQQHRDSILVAGEQSMQEESVLEDTMDFIMLSPPIKPSASAPMAHRSKPTIEEADLFEKYDYSDQTFDAGVNHAAAAAVVERKRLEKEASDFDLWRGADFLPEEDPDDGELLLDELEQDDILTELLRNARKYICFRKQL